MAAAEPPVFTKVTPPAKLFAMRLKSLVSLGATDLGGTAPAPALPPALPI